jgi:tRNA dimethylallyltransferase
MAQGGRPIQTILIAGPTAGGKSALALALAERLGGEIINADSMQVYAELPVLSAAPGPAERARVPHRLYGVLKADEPCSAARWAALARDAIAAAHAAGRAAILVGGTGLYFRALLDGLADIPNVPAEVRAEATALHARLGGGAFRTALAVRDPTLAARLAPGDTQRLIRAWEVVEATGRPLSEWQAGGTAGALDLPWNGIVLAPPRDLLLARFGPRLRGMVEAGALDEVRGLVARGLDPALPAMKAVGVPALRRHLAGEIDLDEALALAEIDTRRYSKRQLTWARKHMADWLWFGSTQQMESLTSESLRFIQT